MKQGITTNILNDKEEIARVQVDFDGSTIDNVVLIQAQGEHAIPPKGTNCLVCQVSDNQYFAFTNENIERPKDLKDGEKATGNFKAGCMIKYRDSGEIEILNKKASITIKADGEINIKNSSASIDVKTSGDVVINAGSNNAVQYQAMDLFIQSLVNQVNAELGKKVQVPATSPITIAVDTSTSKITKFKVE